MATINSPQTNRYKLDVNGFDTLDALRNSLSYLHPRGVAAVFGSSVAFDGAQSFFMWNPNDRSADNDSTIIKPATLASSSAGRWNLLTENPGSNGVFVRKTGDTMAGFLTLNDDPEEDLHAATKQYVDSKTASADTPLEKAFLVAASTWSWTHGLGYYPMVQALNLNREVLLAYIDHVDANTVTAVHTYNETGYLIAT